MGFFLVPKKGCSRSFGIQALSHGRAGQDRPCATTCKKSQGFEKISDFLQHVSSWAVKQGSLGCKWRWPIDPGTQKEPLQAGAERCIQGANLPPPTRRSKEEFATLLQDRLLGKNRSALPLGSTVFPTQNKENGRDRPQPTDLAKRSYNGSRQAPFQDPLMLGGSQPGDFYLQRGLGVWQSLFLVEGPVRGGLAPY